MERENKQKLIQQAATEYLNSQHNIEPLSLTVLSKKYHIKRETLSKYIKLLGGTIINRTNAKSFDNTVFDYIDTEEKSYWLGFLYADGCVTVNNSVELGLIKSDFSHLVKYRKFLKLKSNTSIKINENLCRVRVSNYNLALQLKNKGCVSRKSLILTFPNKNVFENENLIRHFIRGYVDGDGCLRFYKNKKGVYVCDLEITGTKMFLNELKTYLNVPGGFIRNCSYREHSTTVHKLSYRCTGARIVARLLYQNSKIYLDRKYEIYKSFCRFEEQSSNAKSSKIGEGWDANTELID